MYRILQHAMLNGNTVPDFKMEMICDQILIIYLIWKINSICVRIIRCNG